MNLTSTMIARFEIVKAEEINSIERKKSKILIILEKDIKNISVKI